MKCPNCGLINPLGAQWCDCGHNFDRSPLEDVPSVAERAPTTANSTQRSRLKTSLKSLAYFFLVWFLLIFLGTGIRELIAITTGLAGYPVLISQEIWTVIAFVIALAAVLMQRIRIVIAASLAAFVLSIVSAVAMPYIIAHYRGERDCDIAAKRDVEKLANAIERLSYECSDINLNIGFDEPFEQLAANNALKYLVGPYYLWDGCSKKCEVVVRLSKMDGEWVIEGAALKGSHPSGPQSRYVYRLSPHRGRDLPPVVVDGVMDAKDGNAQNWNSYPAAGPSSAGTCYGESCIEEATIEGKPVLRFRVPRTVPCQQAAGMNR